jgi:RNA polymerase sigma-70 factor, ECF subfamily
MVELKKKPTEKIIEDLKRGRHREANYKLLFDRYHDQVYRFFRRKGLGREDCRDLTQDVFVLVYRGLHELRDHAKFHSWLFKIARNTFSNEIERRQAKKREGHVLPLEEKPGGKNQHDVLNRKATDLNSSPMEALLEKERRAKVVSAIQDLPPQMRRCVQLRINKGLSIAEIAGVMRISANTVKAHLHQARSALKEDLAELFSNSETEF